MELGRAVERREERLESWFYRRKNSLPRECEPAAAQDLQSAAALLRFSPMAGPSAKVPAAHERRCATCGSPLTGTYCSQCGERELGEHAPTMWHFVSHTLLHELTHLDGKILRTLRYLFFRPGFLTEEHFAGRRQPYINPVRLLLTAVIAFAVLAPGNANVTMAIKKVRLSMLPPGPPVGVTVRETAARYDLFGLLAREIAAMGSSKDLDSGAATEKFHHELKTYGTVLSFSNVVLFAGLLFVFFRRQRPYFVEHLVFSLHFASFLLLFAIFPLRLFQLLEVFVHSVDLRILQVSAGLIALLILFVQLRYLHKGLMQFYYHNPTGSRRRWSRQSLLTTLALTALFIGNALFMTLVDLAGAAIALTRL